MDLASAALSFVSPGGWVSNRISPTFESNGGTTLDPNEEDSLFFNITNSPGVANSYRINGDINATETNSGRALVANTNTSGFGNVLLQTPASLSIQSVVKSQEPVTSWQTTPWTVDVTVTNTGQATATLSLLRDDSYIFFTSTGDSVSPATGDVTLPNGTSQTLTFTVSPTPSFGSAGNESFDVQIGAIEDNRGVPVSTSNA